MGRLSVELCGIEMDNPIIPASGTFGYGYEFAELYDINVLGTFSFKGTTKDPRFGRGLCSHHGRRCLYRDSLPGFK